MQELTVIGIESDGKYLICQEKLTSDDSGISQTFRLCITDELRTMVCKNHESGTSHHGGGDTISNFKPRDIQARIRAGASVEQIATISGMEIPRIQRFAHTVLLERERVASLAGKARPVKADGSLDTTLAEIVNTSFIQQGLNPDSVHWDSWRIDEGQWLVQLTWVVDQHDQIAQFHFSPGAHGGTIDIANDTARHLLYPHTRQRLHSVLPLQVPLAPTENPIDSPTEKKASMQRASGSYGTKQRRKKPEIPGWEDVLLGVRSSAHQ